MTDKERLAREYVMVGCVASVTRKGKKIYASSYGLRCFPLWRKKDKGHAINVASI